MSFIKINDPAIIDLAAWHQIIQVVNQHSDSIAAITNDYGAALSVTNPIDGDNWRSVFDIGSQVIQFGRARLTGTPTQSSDGAADVKLYNSSETLVLTYRPYFLRESGIAFAYEFSSKPIVVATLQTSLDSRTEFKVTVGDVTTDSFMTTVSGFDKPDAEKTVYVNWIAVGPK